MADITILAKGSDTPRTKQGNLAPGLYAWPRGDCWVVQDVSERIIKGAFASTINAALAGLA